MRRRRVLGIAVASGRVGYMLMHKGTPHAWKLSQKAAESPKESARYAQELIDQFRPNVVVTQDTTQKCQKGKDTKKRIRAIAKVAANSALYDISVVRPRQYRNKYLEAEALVGRFPALRPWLPASRELWEGEPHKTTIFEALALALVVVDREPGQPLGDGENPG